VLRQAVDTRYGMLISVLLLLLPAIVAAYSCCPSGAMATQPSAAQHSTAQGVDRPQHSTAQHSTAQRSTVQGVGRPQHSTAQHGMAQHSMTSTECRQALAQHSTAQSVDRPQHSVGCG